MRRWLSSLKVYAERRVIGILFLGFASGLPLLLTLSTLSFWMAEVGVSKKSIGLFALVGTPYSLKFMWAPLLDRLHVPVLTRALGRRRSWALLIQAALIVAILALGATSPADDLVLTAVAALGVAFFSASQDIIIDAYRVELLEDDQQGAGSALAVTGYRLGMLASGAGALYLATALSWASVYAIMAGLVLVGTAAVLLLPEPEEEAARVDVASARGSWRERIESARAKSTLEVLHVVVLILLGAALLAGLSGIELAGMDPLSLGLWIAIAAVLARILLGHALSFTHREGWWWILIFVAIFKLGDAMAGIMAMPFYYELQFTKAEIASITKVFGLVATIVGGLAGGVLVKRYGILRALLLSGVLQMVSNLVFTLLALIGRDLAMLTLTIGFENLASGMGAAAFVAYLSALCDRESTATQYALLSSLASLGRTVLSSWSGYVAAATSWATFFAITTAVALPGLLLLLYLTRTAHADWRDAEG